MAHEYIKENDIFSISRNGTVPKPTQADVTAGKVLKADGTWGEGGGGGGSSTLAGLTDVELSSPSAGQILKYDAENNKWVNADESGGYAHHYSTTEQVVGTWIDGKPLYEKTVTFGVIPANSMNYLVDCSILTVDNLIDISCVIHSGNNFFKLPFPLLQQGETYSNYGANLQAFDKSTGKLRIDTGAQRAASGGYVTLQYTKTTD